MEAILAERQWTDFPYLKKFVFGLYYRIIRNDENGYSFVIMEIISFEQKEGYVTIKSDNRKKRSSYINCYRINEN